MHLSVNGTLIPDTQAVVPFYDHGFLYGIGLFETFRTYGGRPFRLDLHLRRLAEGCRSIGIVYEPDENELRQRITRLMEKNGCAEAYVRLSVSAGEQPLGLHTGDYDKPNEWIFAKPLAPAAGEACNPPRTLQLLRTRRNSPEGDVRLKSFHYLNNWLAKRELRELGAPGSAEGVMTDARGAVAEGIVSNIFWVRDGKLFTPDLSTGILPGVTRGLVLELAQELGVAAEQGAFGLEELLGSDEAFLTNSIQEIVPVDRIREPDGRETPLPAVGEDAPVTRALHRAYRCLTEREMAHGNRP
ncbi:aminotransferase class IV [Paenibacillus thermoaerophilus]|uniref:Aminotransferase class IV n=1 Tax=Paenibacillus thermoaerophilus TaxID=1215385 RepID=A0ABW2V296_9BACL|nr:aminotransferase class IV [Paenibacillus thermoaerophilus]TMV09435.1 4-amino-4-deoxychorismate lyase [Paenibacillus thermoaerophilus]